MAEIRLSATLYQRFLACPKHASLSLNHSTKHLAKPSLRAALGKVSHQLVESSVRIPSDWDNEEISEWFELNWDNLIDEEFTELKSKWSPNSVMKPQSWPGYFATRASAKSLVLKNSGLLPHRILKQNKVNEAIKPTNKPHLPLVEIFLVSEELGIVGKPDFVFLENEKATIYDYKFGNDQKDLDKHKLQMYFYQLLIESVVGIEVGKLAIVTSANKVWDVPLNPKEIDNLKSDIPRVLEALLTDRVAALPNLSNCRFCDFKSICNPFREAKIESHPGQPLAINGEVIQIRQIDVNFQELVIKSKTSVKEEEIKIYGVPSAYSFKSGDSVFVCDNLEFRDPKTVGFSWNSRIFVEA